MALRNQAVPSVTGGPPVQADFLPADQLTVLWTAWRQLPDIEAEVAHLLGVGMAGRLLALWALSRMGRGASEEGMSVADLFDDDLNPCFSDWMLEDVAVMAFALGAAWARGADAPELQVGLVAS